MCSVGRRYRSRVPVKAGPEGPQEFLWHGKRYRVKRVVARWREAGWDPYTEEGFWGEEWEVEYWRVEATGPQGEGVYELVRDLRGGGWFLKGLFD